jgi:hypothetical protein
MLACGLHQDLRNKLRRPDMKLLGEILRRCAETFSRNDEISALDHAPISAWHCYTPSSIAYSVDRSKPNG